MNLFHPVSSRSVQPSRLRTLFSGILIASLLAGLFPAPLLTTVASNTLPAPMAETIAQSAVALLPEASVAKAAALPLARSAAVAPIEHAAEAVVETPLQIAAAAPLMQSPVVTGSSVLTISKSVNGSTQSNFQVTLTGPSYPSGQLFSIISGTNVINNLVSGVYTVSETSPGAGWTTTYTATTGYSTGSSAVVTLTNPITATRFTATAAITGTVFNDYNSDGNITANGTITDTGVPSVTVSVYDINGTLLATTQSNSSGRYTITTASLTVQGPYRVEFTNLPGDYEPTRAGAQSGTSVQFINSASASGNINFGISQACDYCQNNPNLATTLLTGEEFTGYTSMASLLMFNSSSVNAAARPFVSQTSGNNNQFLHPTPMSTLSTVATQAQVGNLYGLAWHRDTRTLFAAAHGRSNYITNGGIGPSGLGAIYMTKNGVTSLFTAVTNVGTFGYADGNKVGTVGLGDLEVSEDGTILYTVNVFTSQLVKIPIIGTTPTAGSATTVNLPVPADCPAANTHGFALGQNEGKIYVGLTCDGVGTADLIGYVYEYNGSTFTQKIRQTFDYVRPNQNANYYGSVNYADYQPNNLDFVDWSIYPNLSDSSTTGSSPNRIYIGAAINPKTQPWLADIGFDKGDMLLGVRNRLGDARLYSYWVTGGDLLRACANSPINPTTWTMENNGSCGGKSLTVPTTDPYTGRSLTSGFDSVTYGIGGRAYYWGNIGWEGKPSNGDFVQIPGYNNFYATGTDIQSHNNQFGIMAMSQVTGRITGGGHIRASYLQSGPPWDDNGISKGNALGDIVALCDPAPIEIGNRVWWDQDGDGVQDAGEPGISGVVVSLQTVSGTVNTTTDINGNYYFTREATSGTYSTTLRTNTNYTITINSSPAGYTLTVANAQALAGASVSSNNAISDVRDSDASLVGSTPTIYYTTGTDGQNNHGLDFGFTKPASATVQITNTLPPGLLSVTKQVTTTDGSNPTVSGTFTITVDCGGTTVSPSSSQSVASGGTVTFTVAGGSSCSLSENTTNLPAAPAGYVWVAHQLLPNQVTISSGVTSTVLAKNTLSPIPSGGGTLTVTKTISGSGSGPFTITLSSASGVVSTTTINGGQNKIFAGLTSGIYTVTETSPGAGWTTTYTATTGYSTGSSAVVTLSNPITAAVVATGLISGTVYNDFSLDGQISPSDAFVAGVSVSVYDRNGTLVGTATTNISGTYALTPTASGPWRIEFSNLPAGYEPSRNGSQNGSSVQFVSSVPSQVNLGIHQPSYYCQANPDCVATQLLSGTINNSTAASSVLVRFPYTSGSTNLLNYTTNNLPVYSTVAQKQQVGSIFGLAWQRTTGSLFSATYYKADADIAVSPGAIFKGSSLYVDLDTIFPGSFGSEPAIGSQASYTVAGKIGLGGIDIVEDPNNFVNDSLYVVSLFDRQLYRVPTSGGLNSNTITRYPIPGTTAPLPGTAQACAQSDVRPMALGQYQGLLYVGLVCSGESTVLTSSLYAYVYTFDPVTKVFGTAPVVQYPLTYTRQSVYTYTGIAYPMRSTWMPWTNNTTYNTATASPGVWGTIDKGFFYPSPLLSDIAFDGVGTMIMAFRDRFSDQFGAYVQTICSAPPCWNASAGDILKASKTGAQTWSALIDSTFYDTQHEYHEDTATGGLAQVPGRGDVVATVYDPSTSNNSSSVVSGGVLWMTNSSGVRERQYRVYHKTEVDTFGKMSGMGDVEVLCDVAPIEIGNRVWWDQDGDGVQDAGEPGLSGVVVSLQTVSGTVNTTTDINGNYYFTREATSGAYSTTLHANTNYTITINSSPAGYSLTVANAEALAGAGVSSNHAISDVRDSDAWLVSNIPTIYYTTGTAGQNNHGLDFGFTQPASGQVDILNIAPLPAQFGDRVWLESDGDGLASTGTITPVAGMVLTATNGTNTYTATTDSNGFYTFTVPAGTYTVTYGLPPAGYELSSTPGGGVVNAASTGNNTSHSNNTVVTLNAGEVITTVDFGFSPVKVSIGNLVWQDGNDNGLYDTGETVISGLTMELWLDVDGDGVAEPNGDDGSTPLSTTVTVNGMYSFTQLAPGNYFVRIPTPPVYAPLSSIPSDAPDNGVDNDDNGSQPGGPGTQILSPVINLTVGAEPGGSGGGNYDYTVDFGLVDPALGNLVWNDIDNDGVVDASEPGILNVVVWLYYDANSNGTIDASEMITPYRTTTTNSQGLYAFSDIAAGNYQVVIPASNFGSGGALAGYPTSSTPTDTADNQQDEDDNGVQASSALTVTGPVVALIVDDEPINSGTESGRGNTLDDGDDNNGDMTIDFGFSAPLGAVLSINKVATPAVVRAGDLVTYTITLSNSGPSVASNVTVRDLLPAEVTYVSSTATAGTYDTSTSVWTIPSLPVSTQTLTITARVK